MNIRMYQCVLPAHYWDLNQPHVVVAQIIQDALVCERQITKGVNLEQASVRYHRLCQTIEQEIMQDKRLVNVATPAEFHREYTANNIPFVELHHDYLTFLYDTLDDESRDDRIGTSFIPPAQVVAHRTAFVERATTKKFVGTDDYKRRLMLLDMAKSVGGGVIEIQSNFHLYSMMQRASYTPVATLSPQQTVLASSIDVTHLLQDSADYLLPQQKNQMHTLVAQMVQQVRQSQPITIGSTANHVLITEALRRLSYQSVGHVHRANLRVMYVDGSEADSFPLFAIPSRSTVVCDLPPLNVALMSIRHTELDTEIDYCWFRNRDVSRNRTLAETDSYCYRVSMEQLQDALNDGDVIIRLYHTGFEPAVIGFYRAVVDTLVNLRQRQSKQIVHITPMYYRKNQPYVEGLTWC